MDEFGAESFVPSESASSASEGLSEEAKQRFAAQAAAAAQVRGEERKSKKRDQGVAQAIMQFLTDQQQSHLAVLIARLVGRECPSSFILSVLSLINPMCARSVDDDLRERPAPTIPSSLPVPAALSSSVNTDDATQWIGRMQAILARDHDAILRALLVDQRQLDGSLLQLTTFVLQDYVEQNAPPFEQLQMTAGGVLQGIFGTYLQ